MQVNRCLKDKAMDHIDHALGRPLDPMRESYRNYFATTDGMLADEMASSPNWKQGHRDGCMRYFHVTAAGRKTLAGHLREIGDPHRAFVIRFGGHERTVIATNRGKAKYSYFLDVSDVWPDLTFMDFSRRCSVAAA